MNPPILRLFFNPLDIRPLCQKPHVHDGYLYATNGHMGIRAPVHDAETSPDGQTIAKLKLWHGIEQMRNLPADQIRFIAFPQDFHVIPCETCGGNGIVRECPTCRGLDLAMDDECSACDGWNKSTKQNPVIDGHLVCEACEGLAWTIPEEHYFKVGESFYDERYLYRIHTAAQGQPVQFFQTENFSTASDFTRNYTLFFAFGDVEGILQPVKP